MKRITKKQQQQQHSERQEKVERRHLVKQEKDGIRDDLLLKNEIMRLNLNLSSLRENIRNRHTISI